MVLTDGERLVTFVRVVSGRSFLLKTPAEFLYLTLQQPPTIDIHVLEDRDASTSSGPSCSRNQPCTRCETALLTGYSYQLA